MEARVGMRGRVQVREGLQQGNADLGLSSKKGTFLSKDVIPAWLCLLCAPSSAADQLNQEFTGHREGTALVLASPSSLVYPGWDILGGIPSSPTPSGREQMQ